MLCFVIFTGLNPYLTLNTSSSGTILIDLSSEDKEFQSVEEEVCLSLYPNNIFVFSTKDMDIGVLLDNSAMR